MQDSARTYRLVVRRPPVAQSPRFQQLFWYELLPPVPFHPLAELRRTQVLVGRQLQVCRNALKVGWHWQVGGGSQSLRPSWIPSFGHGRLEHRSGLSGRRRIGAIVLDGCTIRPLWTVLQPSALNAPNVTYGMSSSR